MDEGIRIEPLHEGIVRLTICRPAKRNALSLALMKEFRQVLSTLSKDSDNRVLILQGEGSTFCTGLDLLEVAEPKKADEGIVLYANLLKDIYLSPMITISSVHGAAIAGGVGVASVCDYVIASEETEFGFPEIHRGLVAAVVFAFLKRQVGERAMKELFLFGEIVSAERARQIGLVNRVVSQSELENAVFEKGMQALMSAPMAVGHLKKLIEEVSLTSLFDDVDHALAIHKVARSTKESIEGIRAFFDKKEPSWYPSKSV